VKVIVVLSLPVLTLWAVLTHGTYVGKKLQYLGGKLQNAGDRIVIKKDRPPTIQELTEIEKLHQELDKVYQDYDICQTYLTAALKLPKIPGNGQVEASRKAAAARLNKGG
jgi:uncharacterized protein (DUF488 family)